MDRKPTFTQLPLRALGEWGQYSGRAGFLQGVLGDIRDSAAPGALSEAGHELVQVLLADPRGGEVGGCEAARLRRAAVRDQGPQGGEEAVRQPLDRAVVVEARAVDP